MDLFHFMASLLKTLLAALILSASFLAAASAGPALNIDAGSQRHNINADIYGINLLNDEALAAELRLPLRRWGGNATTRYNWQNDTTNTAQDWFYENIPNDNLNPAALPDGSASDRFVEQDQRTGTSSLITVPTIGWVAKRRTSGHPFDCGFKISKYGVQQATDVWDADCGNGVAPNGSKITGNDPTDTGVASSPGFVTSWINHLTAKYGTATNGGVNYYALDNEPGIWNSTHRDVHPLPLTYDEMRSRSLAYGAAVKAADPSAKTLGPAEDGWCRYLYSAADDCQPGLDYAAHGSVQYVPWYLQQMKGYEQQHGVRILDYLDLHYYTAGNGVSLSPTGSTATQALRLRSTRSLWDASYKDESWISDTAPGGVAVNLIPRMKQWVANNYPGTKLAITEYNWGAPESMNGALAQADVLGIFGREGLDMATLWGDVQSAQPLSFAFRMFRNYDGLGHGFGETAVQSVSTDQSALAVYAAQRSTDGVLTIMVINKSASALTSTLSLTGFNPQTTAMVYRYGQANFAAIQRDADQAVTATGFSASFPASSITLLALSPTGQTSYVLDIARYGSGIGSISSSPAGILCGAACNTSFISGSSVTLTARHPAGNAFLGWSGDCSGSGTCVVSMNAAKNVVATFASGSVTPVVALDPALDFAPQFVGTTSPVSYVTLINNGGGMLSIGNITASTEFAVTNDCNGSLAPGAFCHLSVSFSPTATGARVGTLTVADNAAGSPHRVTLSGTGIASAVPTCSLGASPATITRGGTSTLTANCNPPATSYIWTGGTCAGSLLANCTVTPSRTTMYSVTGTNNNGTSLAAIAKVTVKHADITPILMLLLD